MKVNAVFEGGGVKAIGLAGALESAEKRGFEFQQLAGTSSGSIVAAFIAAGYKANEIKQMILDTPFTQFLQRTWLLRFKVIGPTVRLFIKKGLYSGERLEYWVHQQLARKGVNTFGDLQPNQLRIIASDISSGRLLVLPDDIKRYGMDPQRFPVSKAIRMSTSIPYFFEPVILRKPLRNLQSFESFVDQFVYVVDGGILSNFPLWIFDQQQLQNMRKGSLIPTLGFQLVGRARNEPHRIFGPLSMFQALFTTMMEAHDERYIEQYNRFRTIKIPTLGVKSTQFDIDLPTSNKLYESGYQAAEYFFEHKWSLTQYESQFTDMMRHFPPER